LIAGDPTGVGLGLRRTLLDALLEPHPHRFDFYEIAPENWMRIGGRLGRKFRELTERETFVAHGLSLSLGGPEPLDEDFLLELKTFLARHTIAHYSEHLSASTDGGHLYDLMPIPFTEAAVRAVSERIQRVQDLLGQKMAIENVSYYAAPGSEMDEIDFLKGVAESADCNILLDVNNVFVNSVNHGYDAWSFIEAVPASRVIGLHVAGHFVESEDLLIDTHGAPVVEGVFDLLARTYARLGPLPTLLERDFNIPPLQVLGEEVEKIRSIQTAHA
jgi:uncharacterized protein (UPF0276 family)